MWDKAIELISVEKIKNANGFYQDVDLSPTHVYAMELSVSSAEFHRASRSGYTIIRAFKLRATMYKGQEKVKFEGEELRVRRTFPSREFVELYCERWSDNHE